MLGTEFTKSDQLRMLALKIQMSPGGEPVHSSDDGVHGYRFATEDGKRIVQFQKNGFTYNQLSPYTNGDDLRSVALSAWSAYCQVARPDQVVRVAMRYINRLTVPRPFREADHLNGSFIPIADDTLVSEAFYHRSTYQDPTTDNKANLTVALEPDVASENLLLTIDVDVFTTGEFGLVPDILSGALSGLRDLKNRVFFGVVSDSLVERFT